MPPLTAKAIKTFFARLLGIILLLGLAWLWVLLGAAPALTVGMHH